MMPGKVGTLLFLSVFFGPGVLEFGIRNGVEASNLKCFVCDSGSPKYTAQEQADCLNLGTDYKLTLANDSIVTAKVTLKDNHPEWVKDCKSRTDFETGLDGTPGGPAPSGNALLVKPAWMMNKTNGRTYVGVCKKILMGMRTEKGSYPGTGTFNRTSTDKTTGSRTYWRVVRYCGWEPKTWGESNKAVSTEECVESDTSKVHVFTCSCDDEKCNSAQGLKAGTWTQAVLGISLCGLNMVLGHLGHGSA